MGILTRILTQILTRNRLGYRLGDVGGRGRATDAEADGAGGGELGGVAEEVVEHLLDPLRVAPASRSAHTATRTRKTGPAPRPSRRDINRCEHLVTDYYNVFNTANIAKCS